MANELQADDNTYVGYNFITKEFYVRNLDTKTAAKSATDAKLILDVASPGNKVPLYSSGSVIGIADLPNRLESITNIYFTWEDSGKYIKNIYFNEYKSFAIQYDEPNLFIRGSIEMWDMSSTIDYETVASYMQQYYTNYLGLKVDIKLMKQIIKYFKNIQQPFVYNVIATQTDEQKEAEEPLMYSNVISVCNTNKTARGEYNGTKNPDYVYDKGKYKVSSLGSTVKAKLYGVSTINKNQGRIYLTQAYPNVFTANTKIRLYGTNVEGLDGDYTVASVGTEGGNHYIKIVDTEAFSANFSNFYISDVLMKLDNNNNPTTETISGNIITLEDAPACKKGTILQLVGNKYQKNLSVNHVDQCYATNTADLKKNVVYVNESLNVGTNTSKSETHLYTNAYSIQYCGYGNYTEIKSSQVISRTSGNNVYLQNPLYAGDYYANETVYIQQSNGTVSSYTVASMTASSYNASTGALVQGYVTLTSAPPAISYYLGADVNYLQVRNTTKKAENSFTLDLTNSATMPVSAGDTFDVLNAGDLNKTYIVESVDGNKIYVVIKNDEDNLPEMSFNENDRAILQIRTYSERILLDMLYSKHTDKMPMGSFMLDNDEQFTNYLKLYNIITPTSQNYADFDQPVNMKYHLGDSIITVGDSIDMTCVGIYSSIYGEEQ